MWGRGERGPAGSGRWALLLPGMDGTARGAARGWPLPPDAALVTATGDLRQRQKKGSDLPFADIQGASPHPFSSCPSYQMTFAYAQPRTFVWGVRPPERGQGWNGLALFPWQAAGIAPGTSAPNRGPERCGRRCLCCFPFAEPRQVRGGSRRGAPAVCCSLVLPWNKGSPAAWSRLGYSGNSRTSHQSQPHCSCAVLG